MDKFSRNGHILQKSFLYSEQNRVFRTKNAIFLKPKTDFVLVNLCNSTKMYNEVIKSRKLMP